ncbi:hypothetical protein CBS101457_004463 [Exobasidium rhododendri]|nr:hypothetical protein CBS101457_004463 [Exobasidium rhododendri]
MAWIDHGRMASGYWGEITSSLIWCEEKYRWSKYIAEPVNTFTNIFFFLLALYGAQKSREEKLPLRFTLVYLGIAGIGVGSFLFHATLKYEAQLLDELPMIYTSALLTYCVLETTPGYGKPRFRFLLPTALFLLVSFITVGYIYLGNPVFHQVAYALIQITSTIQVCRLLYSEKTKLTVKQRQQIKHIFQLGSAIFVFAFGIWNIDNIYCSQLRHLRRRLGFPWAVLLEGHGWWHLGTGSGAYLLLVASELLMLSIKESADNFELRGHLLLPYVKRVKDYHGKQLTERSRKSK